MKDSGLTLPDDDPGWQTAAVAMSIWIYVIVKKQSKVYQDGNDNKQKQNGTALRD